MAKRHEEQDGGGQAAEEVLRVLGVGGLQELDGDGTIAEVMAAGERPASLRRTASAASDRAESIGGTASFTTAVGAVADPVTSTSSIPP